MLKNVLVGAVIGVFAISCISTQGIAADPDQVKKLIDLKDCEKCDISGADLKKADLQRAEIDYINFEKADLEGALAYRSFCKFIKA